jgi:hypothetical protein
MDYSARFSRGTHVLTANSDFDYVTLGLAASGCQRARWHSEAAVRGSRGLIESVFGSIDVLMIVRPHEVLYLGANVQLDGWIDTS